MWELLRDADGVNGFADEFVISMIAGAIWFALTAIVLSFLIPYVIDARQWRRQRRVRRMIAARAARVHEKLVPYIEYLKYCSDKRRSPDHESPEKIDLGNALYHFMDVPKHFSIALRGPVAEHYYEYRVDITCAAAFFATKAGDYSGLFQQIFFTNIDIFEPDMAKINSHYRSLIKSLGLDAWRVNAMQQFVPPWTRRQTRRYQRLVRFFGSLDSHSESEAPFVGAQIERTPLA